MKIDPGFTRLGCVNVLQPWASLVMDGRVRAFLKNWSLKEDQRPDVVGIYAHWFWNNDWLDYAGECGYQRVALGAVIGTVKVLECVPARHKGILPAHERRMVDKRIKGWRRDEWYYWRVEVVDVFDSPYWWKASKMASTVGGLWTWRGHSTSLKNWKVTGDHYQMGLGI